VLIPRLCQQVIHGGEVKFGHLTVSQRGVAKSDTALAWADFHDTAVSNGSVLVHQREKRDKRKLSPFATVDLVVVNAIVLPSVLERLRSFYTS
jgi:hypothetical protein